jgi:ankyrin repeat-rich membrane spanning protein
MSVDERRVAAQKGDFQQLNLLVVEGIVEDDVSGSGYERTVLDYACEGGRVDCVVLLLEQYNANVDARGGCGWTPFIWAAYSGHVDVCTVLLEHKADIEAVDDDGCNALSYALSEKEDDCARLLIENGANISNVKLDEYLRVIPSWVHCFIAQRERCRHAAIVLLGSLRKVFTLLSP